MKAAGHAVEVVKPGGYARDVVRIVRHFLHAVEQLHHQRFHGLEAFFHARAFFADLENFLFGFVEHFFDGHALRVECLGGNFVRGGNEFAQDGAFPHDLGIAADVAGTGHKLCEGIEVDQSADFLGLANALQGFKDGDDVGGLAGVDELADGFEHQLVFVPIKIAGNQQVGHTVPGMVVEQQPAQHTGFRFDGVGRYAQLRQLRIAAFIRPIGIVAGRGVDGGIVHGGMSVAQKTMVGYWHDPAVDNLMDKLCLVRGKYQKHSGLAMRRGKKFCPHRGGWQPRMGRVAVQPLGPVSASASAWVRNFIRCSSCRLPVPVPRPGWPGHRLFRCPQCRHGP